MSLLEQQFHRRKLEVQKIPQNPYQQDRGQYEGKNTNYAKAWITSPSTEGAYTYLDQWNPPGTKKNEREKTHPQTYSENGTQGGRKRF